MSIDHKRHVFLPATSLGSFIWINQLPCHVDNETVLWRDPYGNKLRPTLNSQGGTEASCQ